MEKKDLILKVKEQIENKIEKFKSTFYTFMSKTKENFQTQSLQKKISDIGVSDVITVFDSFIDGSIGDFQKEMSNTLQLISNEIQNTIEKKNIKSIGDMALSKAKNIYNRQKNLIQFVDKIFKTNNFNLDNLKSFVEKLNEEKDNLNEDGKKLLKEGKEILKTFKKQGDKIITLSNDMINKTFDSNKIEELFNKLKKNAKKFFTNYFLDNEIINELKNMAEEINKVDENTDLDNELNEITEIFWKKFEEFIDPAINYFKNFIRNIIKLLLDGISEPKSNLLTDNKTISEKN